MEHCSILHFMYIFNTICTIVMLKCTLFCIFFITSDDMYFIYNFINIIIVHNILSLRRNSKN